MKTVALYMLVTITLSWLVAHAIAIPAERAYAAIFQPIVEALHP